MCVCVLLYFVDFSKGIRIRFITIYFVLCAVYLLVNTYHNGFQYTLCSILSFFLPLSVFYFYFIRSIIIALKIGLQNVIPMRFKQFLTWNRLYNMWEWVCFVDKAIILTRTKDENNNTTYTQYIQYVEYTPCMHMQYMHQCELRRRRIKIIKICWMQKNERINRINGRTNEWMNGKERIK